MLLCGDLVLDLQTCQHRITTGHKKNTLLKKNWNFVAKYMFANEYVFILEFIHFFIKTLFFEKRIILVYVKKKNTNNGIQIELKSKKVSPHDNSFRMFSTI